MSVISRIDADLLRSLSGATGGSGSSSTINGQGKRTTFDSQGLNLRSGLEATAQIFQNSFLRLGDAITVVSFAQTALEKFLDITEKMLVLAKQAGENSSSSADRSRLNRAYKTLVRDFRKILKEAEGKGVNLLDQGDVRKVLQAAGVNTAAATELVQIFEKLAGADDIFGYEKFRIESRFVGTQERRTVGTGTLTPRFSRGGGDGTFSSPQTTNYVDIDTWFFNNVTRGDGTFKSAVTLEGLVGETKFVDLNKNGVLDRITVSGSTNQYSVALGNGDGTFLADEIGGTLGATVTRTGFVIGDFDGDTFDDMVVANGDGNLEYFIGRGDGTFKYVQSFTVGTADLTNGATLIEKVDINNDGNLDIVVARSGASDDIAVLYGNGNGSFRAPVSFALASTTTGPQSIVLADLNQDGVKDLIVGGQDNSAGIQVLIANTDGTFLAAVSYAGAFDSTRLMVGDINNDGLTDLVRLDSSGGAATAYIRIGNGDGTLKAEVSYNTGLIAAGDALLGDYTGDGQLDILVAAPGAGTMRMLQGNGDGTFKASVFVASGALNSTISLTQADLNRDGSLEIIQYSSAGMSVLMGNQGIVLKGDGSFKAGLSQIAIQGNYAMELADVNGDGNVDLISGDLSNMYVALGNGDGSFRSRTSFTNLPWGAQYRAVDVNDDGKLDIVSGLSGTNTAVFIGNGDGSFKAVLSFKGNDAGSIVSTLESADFNGDGRIDLLRTTAVDNTVEILFGNGDGTFKYAVSVLAINSATGIAVGDFDGDGIADIVGIGGDGRFVAYGNGDGSFRLAQIDSEGSYAFKALDVSGDGAPDIVSLDGSVLKVTISNGDGSFRKSSSYVLAAQGSEIQYGDVDGDGIKDLVVSGYSTNLTSVLLGNGDGTFKAVLTLIADGAVGSTNSVRLADLNRDGTLDIVTKDNGGNSFVFLGNGTPQPATFGYSTGTGSTPVDVKLLDANRDGKLDIIAVDSSRGTVSVQIGNGDGTFKSIVTYKVGVSPSSLSFTDTNGDGIDDLVVANQGGDNVSVLLGNGDGSFKIQSERVLLPGVGKLPHWFDPVTFGNGTFQTALTVQGLSGGQSATLYDLNRDGKLDIVGTAGTGVSTYFFVQQGNGDGSFGAAITLFATPWQGDTPIVADFDRDGIDDIAVSVLGGVQVFKGNGDLSFKAPFLISFGSSADRIFAKDFNSDGVLDIGFGSAFFNTVNIALGNGDGTFKASVSYSAYQADRVAFGDVNGDGILDAVAANKDLQDSVSVLIGNSDGTFKAAQTYAGLGNDLNLFVADFNGDGFEDIISGGGNVGHAGITVLLANQDGTFKAVTTYTFSSGFTGVGVIDYDRDGKLDFVGGTTGNAVVFRGNGDGTFRAAVSSGGGGGTNGRILGMGDLNRDGAVDLLFNTDSSTVNVYLGKQATTLVGDGTFKAPITQTGNVFAVVGGESLKSADFNGDGILDLVSGFGTKAVSLGNGDGSFKAPVSFQASGMNLFASAVADLNNDGVLDLVVTGSGAQSYALIGNGDGTFRAGITLIGLDVGSFSSSLFVVDTDGDGNKDVLRLGANGGKVELFLGNGDGSFSAGQSLGNRTYAVPGAIGDLNGDGHLDIVSNNFNERSLLGNGDGTFRWSTTTFNVLESPLLIELDGDGRTDLIISAGGVLYSFRGFGDGSFAPIASTALAGNNATISSGVQTGDFNGDGVKDFVIASYGSNKISVVLGNADGSLKALTTLSIDPAAGNARGVTVGDFNLDGADDILVVGTTANTTFLFLGNGTPQPATAGSTTNDNPVSVQLLDANRDGKLDLVTADRSSNTVSVAIGNGDGSFKLRTIYSVGQSPASVQFEDLNNDGVLDLVTADEGGSTVSVLLGNGDGTFKNNILRRDLRPWDLQPVTGGDGTFKAAVSLQGFSGSGEVVASDINGDGILDLVQGGQTKVYFALGRGDGSFKPTVSLNEINPFNTPINVVVADFNADGIMDLAASVYASGNVNLYLGNGNGTFRIGPTFFGGTFANEIRAGDLNGDGRDDLVVGRYLASSIAFLSNGDGTFKGAVTLSGGATSTTLIDLNGDGALDVVNVRDQISVTLGNGDGSFRASVGYTTGFDTRSHLVTDVNGDGVADIVMSAGSATNNLVGVALGNRDGSFKAVGTFNVGVSSSLSGSADLNNDGLADIVLVDNTTGYSAVLFGNGDGSFKARQTIGVTTFSSAPTLADLNGDGVIDLVSNVTDSGPVTILFGNQQTTKIGDGTFKAPTTILTSLISTLAGGEVVDINGDGKNDLIISEVNGYLHSFLGNGDGTFLASRSYLMSGTNSGVQLIDLNSDGKLDAVTTQGLFPGGSLYVRLGNGDGTFKALNTFVVASSGPSSQAAFADFNGDGILDAAVENDSDIFISLGNGDGTFKAASSFMSNGFGDGDAPFAADFNGDGIQDIVLKDQGGTGYVFIGNGDGTFAAPQSYWLGGGGGQPINVSDLSGDGVVDVISSANSIVAVAIGNGDGTLKAALSYASGFTSGFNISFSDFNGDGHKDLILESFTEGTRILLGNANGTFKAFSTLSSNGQDKLIIGDINSDGALDIIGSPYGGIGFLNIYLGNGTTVAATRGTATGKTPTDVQLLDANRDGKLDIITTNKDSSTVSIQLGNGDGTFKAHVTYSAGLSPSSVAFSDVNGDGVLDLVVANQGGDNASVLLGNGDGSFKITPHLYSTGDRPVDIQLVDLNRDGIADMVTADYGSNTVSVQFGNADGSFKARTSFVTGTAPNSISYGDVNRDGRIDLITTDETSNRVSVLFGNTDGSFAARVSYATGAAPKDSAVADVNGDGVLDIVVAEGGANRISVLYGNSNGTFKARQAYETGSNPTEVQVADVNRDGYADIVYAEQGTGKIGVLYGRPDGRFNNPVTYTVGNGTGDVAVGDVNNDGRLDIVGAAAFDNKTNVLLGSGALNTGSSFKQTGQVATGVANGVNHDFVDLNGDGILDLTYESLGQLRVAIGNGDGSFRGGKFALELDSGNPSFADVDRDGKLDAVVVGLNKTWIGLGNGDGSFLAPVSYVNVVGSRDVYLGDIDGDGSLDLVSAQYNQGIVLVSLNNGDGTFKAASTIFDLSQVSSASVADVNGDGRQDIVVSRFGAGINVLFGNGDGSFKAISTIEVAPQIREIKTVDVNNDGALDIVAADSILSSLLVYLGNGDGSFKLSTSFVASEAAAVQVGDFNNDGAIDLLSSGISGGSTMLYGNGDGTFRAQQTVIGGWRGATIGDVNRDGILDYAVSSGPQILIQLGNGSATSLQRNIYQAGDGAVDVKLADFNRDGKSDLVTADSRANTVTVQFGNGDGSFATRLSFATGLNPSSVHTFDINRDGRLDLVVTDKDSNSVSILLGNGDGTFKARGSFATGLSPNNAKILDYNRDGRADIVTVNETDGTVTLLAGNGDGTFKAGVSYYVGGSPQQVAATDLDGDGLIDLAVTLKDDDKMAILYGSSGGTFEAAVTYIAGNLPQGVTIGDINRDGFLDIAGTSSGWNQANVWMGNGIAPAAGTFKVSTTVSAGVAGSYSAVAAADLNGDGMEDLVFNLNNQVMVAFGNGNGTFKARVSYDIASTGGYDSLKLVDVNRDGTLDLLAVGNDGFYNVLLGNQDGSFKSAVTFATGGVTGGPSKLELVDINNDGALDLISTNYTSGTVSVSLGNGDGTFKSRTTLISTGSNITQFAVGDVNRDGSIDLIAGGDGANSLRVYRGNGDGSFKAGVTFTTATNGKQIELADVNGDGILDIVQTTTGNSLQILLGNSNGTFKAGLSVGLSAAASDIVIRDVDGDGALDVLVNEGSGGLAALLTGNGDGTFRRSGTYQVATGSELLLSDLNRDGVLDIVSASTSSIQIALGNRTPPPRKEVFLPVFFETGDQPIDVTLLDLNRDGRQDIISADKGSDTISIQFGNGDGSFKARLSYQTGATPTSVKYADLDRNGTIDFVTTNSADGTVTILSGNADGTLKAAVSFEVGVNPSDVAIVDYNRDGILDLVVADEGSNTVSVLFGNGDGSFQARVSYNVGDGPRGIIASDFNQDGLVDIATLNRDGNSISVLYGNSDGTLLDTQSYTLGNLPAGFTFGDVNRDGKLDLVAAIEGRSRVEVLTGNNYVPKTGTFLAPTSLGADLFNPQAFDINGDGILDIVGSLGDDIYTFFGNGDGTYQSPISSVGLGQLELLTAPVQSGTVVAIARDSVSGGFRVLENQGDGTFSVFGTENGTGLFSSGIADAVVGDYNRDGSFDLVMSNGTNSFLFVGNGDGTFKAATTLALSSSALTAADIDRDGRLDIITGEGILYGNGNGTFTIAGGTAGATDVAVADVNGDGILDLIQSSATGGTVQLGNGDRTFKAAFEFGSGISLGGLQLVDINGNGKLDVVTTDELTGAALVFRGNGNGSFQAQMSYSFVDDPTFGVVGGNNLQFADLNRDGILDLFSHGGVDGVRILLGNKEKKVLGTTDLTFNPSGNGGTEIINGAVSGDLTGDGYADLIVTSEDQNSAYVSISNGDGTFLAPVSYNFSGSPSEVRLADLNGDGFADMVVGTDLGDYEIRLGNGDGTFKTNISFTALGPGKTIVEVGDLNDDGSVDVIAISDTQIGIAFGNGDGTFKAMVTQSGSFGNISQAAVRDLDGDGDTDLIIQQSNGGGAPYSSLVFMSNGNGTFLLKQQFDNAGVAAGNFLADVNSDGIADLVTSYETGGVFEVALGNGNGTFKVAQSFFSGAGRNDVAVTDIDGDGNADVVTSAADDGAIYISFGNGDGTFKAGVSTQALVGNFALSINDFNGDALPDIFVGRQFVNEGAVLLGNGNTDTNGAFSLGGDPRGITYGYFDYDSNLDFAVVDADGSIKLLRGNGDGTFKAVQTVFSDATIGTDPVSLASADFNGDGFLDFAVNTSSGGMVEVILGNGDGTFKSSGLSFVAGTSFNMLAANVTGSSAQDLILADSTAGTLWLLEGNGDGTFRARVSLATTGNPVKAIAGDVNRDGRTDIISISDAGLVEVALSNGDGSFTAMRTLAVQGGDPVDVAFGDVDGDLLSDLVLLTGAGKTLEVFKGNGDGTFRASVSLATVQQGLELQLLDLNSDGRQDIVAATRNPLVTNKSFLEVYLNQGSGTFSTPVTYEQGPRPSDPIIGMFAADINKDGVQDLYTLSTNPHVLPFEGTTRVVTTGVVDVGVGQEGKGDPLRTSVSTAGNAAVALEAISKLQKFIEKDLKGIRKVLDDLKKAQKVARAGVVSSERLAQSALAFRSAGALADALKNAIRVQAPGASLNSIGALDTKLVNDLLKDK